MADFRPTFPCLVHKLSVILTALDLMNRTEKWGKNIQALGYNGARTVYGMIAST